MVSNNGITIVVPSMVTAKSNKELIMLRNNSITIVVLRNNSITIVPS